MIDFVFQNPAKMIFGRDALSHLGAEVSRYGKRVLLITGGGSVKRMGLYDQVMEILRGMDARVWELTGIVPNPVLSRVYEGIRLCRDHRIELILALGGGSVIDTGKAIADGVPYAGDVWDFYAGKAAPAESLPLGVICTFPAAGSEMSYSSVITNEETLQKRGFNSLMNVPRFSLLNPEWAFSLPPYQTACGCVDIMAHMMERYFTRVPNVELTDRLIEAGLKTVLHNAPKVMAKPDDYDARAEITWAGSLAHNTLLQTGRVGDWASHKLDHELSALYGLAHGAGLAILFPAWMTYALPTGAGKLKQFAARVFDVPEDFGTEEEIAREGIRRLRAFYRSLNMPLTLRDANIGDDRLEEMARRALPTEQSTAGEYLPLHWRDALAIYRLAY